MDGAPSKPSNVVVDFTMATALVREIYETLPYDDAKELINAIIVFCRGKATDPETIERMVKVVKQKLSGHRQLMERFDVFLPKKYSLFRKEDDETAQANGHADEGPSCPNPPDPSGSDPMSWEAYMQNVTPTDLRRANATLAQLMAAVNDEKDMCVFLQCLNAYHTKAMSRSEFMEKIPQSIKECGFIENDILQFLIDCKHVDSPQSSTVRTSSNLAQGVADLLKAIEEKFLNLKIHLYEESLADNFNKNIEKYAKGTVDLMWLKATLLFDFKDASKPVLDALQDLFLEFDKIRSVKPFQHILIMEELKALARDDASETPSQNMEVDVSALPRVTPSYIQTPSSIAARRIASGETEIGKTVLGDMVMSISTGTEEDSEPTQRRNVHAELLEKMEDEKLTVSMNIDRLKSMLKHLGELAEAIVDRVDDDAKHIVKMIGIGKTALHSAMLADLFDEDWEETKEVVHNHPKVGIDVLIETLQNKLEEWEEVWKNECPKWERISQANYQASLDPTSAKADDDVQDGSC